MRDCEDRILKELRDEKDKREEMYKEYPLSMYSTTQLKAELRRRKNER